MAFPSRDALTIGFAHVAYRAGEEFAKRGADVAHFEVRTLEELELRAREADVLVVSGLWRNTLLASAPKLRFVQSFSAGTDQYDRALFIKHGVRLANAQGANERAVAAITSLRAAAISGPRRLTGPGSNSTMPDEREAPTGPAQDTAPFPKAPAAGARSRRARSRSATPTPSRTN